MGDSSVAQWSLALYLVHAVHSIILVEVFANKDL